MKIENKILKMLSDDKMHPAFKHYLWSLPQGSRLPRGKYFKNRVSCKDTLIVDTGHHTFDYMVVR